MNEMMDAVKEKAKKIKLLALDVDGVLTDGRIIYGNYGDELKFFNVHDGFGIVLLNRIGIPTVIITAKKTNIVKRRARDFRASGVYYDHNKLKIFNRVIKKFKLNEEEVCFIGDDLLDMPILKRAGLAVAVPNAVEEIRACSHYVTKNKGGKGAVREVCDMILKAQKKWEVAALQYLR